MQLQPAQDAIQCSAQLLNVAHSLFLLPLWLKVRTMDRGKDIRIAIMVSQMALQSLVQRIQSCTIL